MVRRQPDTNLCQAITAKVFVGFDGLGRVRGHCVKLTTQPPARSAGASASSNTIAMILDSTVCRRLVHIGLLLALLGGCVMQAAADESDQVGARALSRAFRGAARHASPSVVTVFSYRQNVAANADGNLANEKLDAEPAENSRGEDVGPMPPQQTEDGDYELSELGSGVIIDPFVGESNPNQESGEFIHWIMTNNHVIANAKKVVIQLPDETELVADKVEGDPASDIAVLRVRSPEPLVVAQYGDSDQLEIGDWVLAIGSPFKLEATVSAGIISAKNRTLERIRRGRLLQTDAAVNPGNSGGPLVDLDGKVIAINTAIATRNGGYQGIGFAIPISHARWIAQELAAFGEVRRSTIGITMVELNAKFAKLFSKREDAGVLVYEIINESPADRANIQPLDVIVEFAGQAVRKPIDLREAIERSPVGSTQTLKLLRGDEEDELEIRITLAPVEDPTATSKD